MMHCNLILYLCLNLSRFKKFETGACGSAIRTDGAKWPTRTATRVMNAYFSMDLLSCTPSFRRVSTNGTPISAECSVPVSVCRNLSFYSSPVTVETCDFVVVVVVVQESTLPKTLQRVTSTCTVSAAEPAVLFTRIAPVTNAIGSCSCAASRWANLSSSSVPCGWHTLRPDITRL